MPNYRNKLEERVARELGDRFQYESIRLRYTTEHTYLPDFYDPITGEIVEVKGLWRADDRRKVVAVIAQNPDVQLTMAFQRPETPIRKGSKTTYAAFCNKWGIAWRAA